jgi:hypothetical protein
MEPLSVALSDATDFPLYVRVVSESNSREHLDSKFSGVRELRCARSSRPRMSTRDRVRFKRQASVVVGIRAHAIRPDPGKVEKEKSKRRCCRRGGKAEFRK